MNGTALKWILLIAMFVVAVAVSLVAFFPERNGRENGSGDTGGPAPSDELGPAPGAGGESGE